MIKAADECIAHGQTVPCNQLVADRLLKARPQVVKEKPQENEQKHHQKASHHPGFIKRRAGAQILS